MAQRKYDFLTQTLSLGQNGGVRYEGARMGSRYDQAVLIVGLGGNGADALLRVKDQITNRMILPTDANDIAIADAPKNIGFLEIDTDRATRNLTYRTAHFSERDAEFCDISVDAADKVIEFARKRKADGIEYGQWSDENIYAVADGYGSSGMRQIGRMLLAYNISKVIVDIKRKIYALTINNPAINDIRIVLLSGISGGTGAGIVLDMAYILRKVARESVPNVNIVGYLLMPDVDELKGSAKYNLCASSTFRANGFACLKELDHWMNCREHLERYRQKFPCFELNELAVPFDFCHLFNASDAQGRQFTYEEILHSIAENVFSYAAEDADFGNPHMVMAQLYHGINLHPLMINPSCPMYLSVGTAKIEIPYTEIATLAAARVFERLEQGMFQNRPSEEEFNATVHRDLEMTEENIRSLLYREVIPRPELQQYDHKDIWPNNVPYNVAYNWLVAFQRAVVKQSDNLSSYLEEKLKDYIKSNLRNKKTGPVYLRYFVKSEERYCLYHMLESLKSHCNEIRRQCGERTWKLKDEMQQRYEMGVTAGVFRRKKAAQAYVESLERWYRNEESAFLNEEIIKVIEILQGRLKIYYDNILKPLTDTLFELPKIFRDNVEIIKAQEAVVQEDTDILIRPLEFEHTKQLEFNAAVLAAENSFLGSLSDNIHKWIGRDVDNVDETIGGTVDVPGFISGFISEHFSKLLTINMENIMTTKLRAGQNLNDYIIDCIDYLRGTSYVMYAKNPEFNVSENEVSILFVPNNCPEIYEVATSYIRGLNLLNYLAVKRSDERNRLYIEKVAWGYPLTSNAFFEKMKEAYESKD